MSNTAHAIPDAIVSISHNHPTITPGDLVEYEFTVSNIGTSAFEYNQSNEYALIVYLSKDNTISDDDEIIGTHLSYLVLEAGESITQMQSYRSTYDMPSGNYYVIAKVDYLEKITESNENNNINVAATINVALNPVTSNCANTFATGNILCADLNAASQVEVYTITDDNDLIHHQLDTDGALLNTENLGTFATDSILIDSNIISKKLANGTIAWQQTIPATIMDTYDNFSAATELSNGDLVLGTLQSFYDQYQNTTPYYRDSIILVKTDANLNLIKTKVVVKNTPYIYPYPYPSTLHDLNTTDDNNILISYTSVTPFAIIPTTIFSLKKLDDNLEEIASLKDVFAYNPQKFIKTPCGTYFIEGVSNPAGQKGHYSGTLQLWIDTDSDTLITKNQLNIGSGSTDYIGRYQRYIFNGEQASTIQAGRSYYQFYDGPNIEDFTINFSNNGNNATLDMPFFPFEYMVQTGEQSVLLLNETAGNIESITGDCLATNQCIIDNLIITNVLCDNNNTTEYTNDDVHLLDIKVEGNGDYWKLARGTNPNPSYPIDLLPDSFAYNQTYSLKLNREYLDYYVFDAATPACYQIFTIEPADTCTNVAGSQADLNFSIYPYLNDTSFPIIQGNDINYRYQIKNQGEADAIGNFNMKAWLSKDEIISNDDIVHFTATHGDLAANSSDNNFFSGTINIPTDFPEGDYNLIIKIDADDAITESDEENNYHFIQLSIENPRADLIGDQLVLNTYEVNAGDALNYTLSFRNTGTMPINDFPIRLWLTKNFYAPQATELIGDFIVNGQYANGANLIHTYEQNITIPSNTPAGSYRILVQMNPDQLIEERIYYNNNIASDFLTIKITPDNAPDLQLSNLNIPTSETAVGNVFPFNFNLHNYGNADAIGSFSIKSWLSKDAILSDDDIQDGIVPTGNLMAGESVYDINGAMTVIDAVTAGQYYLIVKVDADEQQNESNENNNTVTIGPINISSNDVDLQLSNLNVPTTEAAIGSVFSFNFNLHNYGNADATGSFSIKSWLSKDAILSDDDIQDGIVPTGNLMAGESVYDINGAMTIIDAVTAGQYYLIVKVDADEQQNESNENNNTITIGNINIVANTTVPETNCEATSAYPWEEWIANVQVGNLNNDSQKASYTDYSNIGAAQLVQGSNVNWSITANYSYFTQDEYCSIYIDFNQNGAYEANELWAKDMISAPNNAPNASASATGLNSIPLTATIGLCNMRIIMQRDAYAAPCGEIPYGEVEDYQVEILPLANNYSPQNTGYIQAKDLKINIAPNPVQDQTKVQINASEAQESTLFLYNTQGQLLQTQAITLSKGYNEISLSLSAFPSGIYWLRNGNGIPIRIIKTSN